MPLPSEEEIQAIIRIVSGKEPRYERHGACLRCGRCCEQEDCENYSKDTDTGIAACAIFGQIERPRCCLLYPDNPPTNFEGCGYKFYDLVEERELADKEVT